MQLSAFLDVAITLASAYLMVSLLCTTLNEFITTLLKTRAKTLKKTVAALLDDPSLQQAFMSNGLIQSMSKSASGGKAREFPSYLDGKTFAEALVYALREQTTNPKQIAPDPVQQAADLNQEVPASKGGTLEDSVNAIEQGQIKEVLSVILATADTDITAFKNGVAEWFDSAMDRLSGDYVRLMKYASLGMGLLLALTLNVDSVNLAMVSWSDRQTAEIVSAALPENGSSLLAACPKDPEDATALNCQLQVVSQIGSGLRLFPIGWGTGAIPEKSDNWFAWWLLKFFGLLCTGFAVSLGAPFWFDLLQNVMSLRGTGKKPEREADK